MKTLIVTAITVLCLSGCGGKVATITVDPGYNGTAPAVDCHAVVNNPHVQPTSESPKP